MQIKFAPGSAQNADWQSALRLNYQFAARVYAALFGFAAVAQCFLLATIEVPVSLGWGAVVFPAIVGLLAGFEWWESRRQGQMQEAPVAGGIVITTNSIWIAAVLESLVPVVGFHLIGEMVGWSTALGGPPVVGLVVITFVSMLRLDARICFLQGVLGAVGYWSVLWFANLSASSETKLILAEQFLHGSKGFLLIATGILAGLIARQIRRRIQEAIVEQTKRAGVQETLRERTSEYIRATDIILEKNELISILSHDLRAPLDGVASLAQLMGRAPEQFSSDDIRKYADEIHGTARELRELLDNLVVWAELKSGQTLRSPEALSLANLVAPVMRIFEPAVVARRLKVEDDFEPDAIVLGDAQAVSTVIRNLLSNAVKYTPEGGEVRLSVDQLERPAQIALVVSDTGPGIAAEHSIAATDSAEVKIDPRFPSMGGRPGLGLALSRHLLRQLNGKLEFRERASGGTEARMWLPRSPSE